ncbi:MAG: right-handed parallel beta-helix repeat-containing protein [Bacteroidales bacterium]|nr:right-handed parallel beta-helix repeat-containing protein [Bacteroidales bacterium]
MKKYLLTALGAGLLMTSCQSDEPMMNGLGEEQQVAFTVSLPDAVSTRAGGTNSALGGVSNNVGEDVTFNVALYLDGRLVYADSETVPSTGNHTSATFKPTLVIGENYQLVAFAEFDGDATATGEGVNPATNMGLIAIESGINNELNDEYFVTTTVTAAPELSATLKRPYGKLRLIAEDLHEAERQFGDKVESVEVTYKHTRPTNFNVIAGTFNPAYTEGAQTFAAAYGEYSNDTDASRTIFVDYIPGKFDGSDVMMPFTIEVKFANGKTYTRSFTQDIPVRRNWLTTLKGRLFTMDSELTLTIEENFDGETNIDYVLATTATELKDALENAEEGSTILLQEILNYGTVTIGELKNVTIKGGANTVMTFVTDANTKIENVTLDGVDFVYDGSNVNSGIVINETAQIDNLVVDGCTFTGTGAKAGRGLSGYNNNATIEVRNTTFKDLGYPIYAWGSYENLTVEGCTFEGIKSWAVMPQSGFDGNLTVNGNKFVNCVGGLVKAGTLTAGHTFTFTNNVITNSAEHPSRNWFEFKTSAGTKVVEGNIKDGVAWTPGDAEGLK